VESEVDGAGSRQLEWRRDGDGGAHVRLVRRPHHPVADSQGLRVLRLLEAEAGGGEGRRRQGRQGHQVGGTDLAQHWRPLLRHLGHGQIHVSGTCGRAIFFFFFFFFVVLAVTACAEV